MKKMRSSKGFTLIELLVVIAIIGILSSVVLASLTTARSRGTAAAVQNELSNMRAQAELFYSTQNPGSYGTAADGCTGTLFTTAGTGLATLLAGIQSKATGVDCVSSSTAWAVQASVGTSHFCVDSTGKSTSTSAATNVGTATLCP